jgi:flagellar basal body-associated protein FliL
MIFCGQCGLQQAPGATRCPRCGAQVEDEAVAGEYYVDGPTIASFSPVTQPSSQPGKSPWTGAPSPNGPQRLPLGEDKQSILEANAPTRKIDAPIYNTQLASSPSNQNMSTPYAGDPSTSNYLPPGASYPGILPGSMRSAPPSSPYQSSQQSPQKSKGRVASLLIILFGLLLILGAMVIFALKQNGTITGNKGGGNTLSQQAQTLIEQYYTDINNRDYQDAYNLWKNDPRRQTYTSFSQGFAHTRNDQLTVDNVTTLSDGTVKVSVTLNATEDAPSGTGTRTSAYKGYYIVGPQNGVLKILSGQLNQVS